MNTSVLKNARPISSTWSDTNDHAVANYLAEVATVPQIYSQTQPNHIRVELGNDGQQYMIMDGKYFSENAQGELGDIYVSNSTGRLVGRSSRLVAKYILISN